MHVGKHLRRGEVAIRAEGLVNVLALGLVVGIFDPDGDGEPRHRCVGIFGDGLGAERVAGDFALDLQVGGAVGGLQARVLVDIVEQRGLEQWL